MSRATAASRATNGFIGNSSEDQKKSCVRKASTRFRFASASRVAVERESLELDDVLEERRQVPVQVDRPGVDFAAGPGRRQPEVDRGAVDVQRVVPRGDLERTPVPVAEVEVRARPNACRQSPTRRSGRTSR